MQPWVFGHSPPIRCTDLPKKLHSFIWPWFPYFFYQLIDFFVLLSEHLHVWNGMDFAILSLQPCSFLQVPKKVSYVAFLCFLWPNILYSMARATQCCSLDFSRLRINEGVSLDCFHTSSPGAMEKNKASGSCWFFSIHSAFRSCLSHLACMTTHVLMLSLSLFTSFKWTLLEIEASCLHIESLLALSYDRYVWDKTRKCGVSFIFYWRYLLCLHLLTLFLPCLVDLILRYLL